MNIQPVGLFAQHPLQATLHRDPTAWITHYCGHCKAIFVGPVREIYNQYKEHVLNTHMDQLEDCGCCGGYHFSEFNGDCREDWERF